MACSVTCTTAAKQTNGHILVTFSDGSQKEYASLADAYNEAYSLDSDAEYAKKWAIANWLKQDPSASNPSQFINGKTCTVNVGVTPSVQFVGP